MSEGRITITRSMLDKDLDDGLKRKDLAEKYNLSLNQVKKLMLKAGYSKRRASYQTFDFIDDTADSPQTETPKPTAEIPSY